MDISELWRRLRTKFNLKDHPDYEASWLKLRALTRDIRETIETALPSGLAVDRTDETNHLVDRIEAGAACVLFGESGTGKSALVKTMLDKRFPDASQVWFEPENLDLALNEATRAGIGINQPLIDTLDAAASAENFLIIDAAERLSDGCVLKAKALIHELKRRNAKGAKAGWRVLIGGQTEAWSEGILQDLAGEASPAIFEVRELPEITVKDVLRSVAGLEWLVDDRDAVAALSNLRTLAWVTQAAAQFQGDDSTGAMSLIAIADRLWNHWTNDDLNRHRLLVKLAERHAEFEHSFPVSELETGDAAVLAKAPADFPLRLDREHNRIRFQHDLAADWARFQRLKEIRDNTVQWGSFADNPFWHAALRMLGQLLLRRQTGSRCAWDAAFEVAEQNRDLLPLASDLLLDALFLDPNAEAFLEERADMLFADRGARLLRLVKRFEHVGSVPSASVNLPGPLRDLSLYIEAQYRTPIFSRWPAMARFLAKHRERIANLTSPEIAGLCNRWLSSTPPTLSEGVAVPFRREFAECLRYQHGINGVNQLLNYCLFGTALLVANGGIVRLPIA